MESAGRPRTRPAWHLEVVLLVGGYLLFGLARAAVERGGPTATSNARLVQRLEQTVHLAVELPLNQAMLGQPVAIYLTGYFYRLCVLGVPAVLVWLYVTRRPGTDGAGGLDTLDRTGLIAFMQAVETTRNRLPLIDHGIIERAEGVDLPDELRQGSLGRVLGDPCSQFNRTCVR